ncbi:MAG: electron transport complex subunit RsxE [Saprospiraceae bacterium]|nr:electron transport complex subunit RsxE [Saprospiraceae bacterium]
MAVNSDLSKNKLIEEFLKGLWTENPVFVMVLGMCPVLAVSNTAINSLAMGLATMFVLVFSSFLVSIFRKLIPAPVRITTFIIIIATFVTVVDMLLAAHLPVIHKELGAFISLIVVNCVILGRQEAFASKNPPINALSDALGVSVGFVFALFCLGSVREILGNGSFFGIPLFGSNFEPWIVMILPPGGFFALGFILLFFNQIRERKKGAREKNGSGASWKQSRYTTEYITENEHGISD